MEGERGRGRRGSTGPGTRGEKARGGQWEEAEAGGRVRDGSPGQRSQPASGSAVPQALEEMLGRRRGGHEGSWPNVALTSLSPEPWTLSWSAEPLGQELGEKGTGDCQVWQSSGGNRVHSQLEDGLGSGRRDVSQCWCAMTSFPSGGMCSVHVSILWIFLIWVSFPRLVPLSYIYVPKGI